MKSIIEVIRLGCSNDWQVLTTEGNTYRHAIFTGPNAKELAEEYAEFKKSGSAIRAT